MSFPHPDIAQILVDETRLQARVRELAAAISSDYADHHLHLVCVLRGGAIFTADLLRALTIPATLDYIAVTSWAGEMESSGVVRILKDLEDPIEGRHVLLVEDIIDSGLTLSYLTNLLRDRRVASLNVCALLDKKSARKVPASVRYVGFEIGNEFVVGYGLDYRQLYRGLPYIGTLKPEVYGGG